MARLPRPSDSGERRRAPSDARPETDTDMPRRLQSGSKPTHTPAVLDGLVGLPDQAQPVRHPR